MGIENEIKETVIEDKSNVEANDTLTKIVAINKFSDIKENLWKKVENIRNKNKNIRQFEDSDELSISFDKVDDKEKTVEQSEEMNNVVDFEKSKQLRLGRSAFVSVSIMAITTTVVSLSIVILGLIALN